MFTRGLACALTLAAAAFLAAPAPAQAIDLPNPSFEDGEDAPTGWTLSGGQGDWTTDAPAGKRAVTLTGNGESSNTNYWRSPALPFEPFTVYQLTFQGRRVEGSGGCPTSGPVFCNRDLSELDKEWAEFTSIFVTPSTIRPNDAWLRFGQWEINGTVAYDDIRLTPAQPVYLTQNGISLGEGESVNGTAYTFKAPLSGVSQNHARPLARQQCYFNRPRWCFGADSELVYRHELPGRLQQEAQFEVTIGLHSRGKLHVSVRTDGAAWQEIGAMTDASTGAFDIPAALLPAPAIWVRLSSQAPDTIGQDSDPGSFQVHGYIYHATLDKELPEAIGRTSFVAVTQSDPRIDVQVETFGLGLPGGDNTVVAQIRNTTDAPLKVEPCLELNGPDGIPSQFISATILEPGLNRIRIPYELTATGTVRASLTFGPEVTYAAQTTFEISDLYNSTYGELLPPSTDAVGLWWASSGWKVARTRAMPTAQGKAIHIQAAQNEVEAAQLIICPAHPLTGFLPTASPLTGPNGATLPAEAIELLRVGYVPVAIPTDQTGVAAPWPDPLPPFQGPIDLAPGQHQPIWVRINAPRDAAPGTYTGSIQLNAQNYTAQVPLEVEIFHFALPDRMTLTTAFGFSAPRAFHYHNVTEPQHQRQVYDQYLAALAAHHISPYNPAALDSFGVKWPQIVQWQGGIRDTQEKYAGQAALLIQDDSTTDGASAQYDTLIPIPDAGVQVRFAYKTKAPGHRFIITLLHHDANGQWMYGKNTDIPITGDGTWQTFERTITTFPQGAEAFMLRLWAALYAEDGSTTGAVWFDDLRVEDAATGALLIEGGFDPLQGGQLDALKPTFDWTAWDQAMTKAMDEYHFNSLSVPIQGMGGGTFHARHEPSLLGYTEDTPEYKAAFTAYCEGVQQHLDEKGWLDGSYVYWFDEPDPKDYDFVMNGFHKLRDACPGIGRMLTEQVEPGLIGGPNIWCPLTPAFDLEVANERRKEGDTFWWYICTGPKAPYVTLFIDHPGAELRVWSWQTWKRRISGLLIWETNYWTSAAAYPDPEHPQNPYEDPMGWRTGYSTPPGTKAPWGNGDGRFIYPPEAAADGRPPQPVLDKPVDSIRFEMLRDGIEDYEYMVMLDRLIKAKGSALSEEDRKRYEALLEVPNSISTDLTHFTTDPAPIERRRAAVAKAIEELAKR